MLTRDAPSVHVLSCSIVGVTGCTILVASTRGVPEDTLRGQRVQCSAEVRPSSLAHQAPGLCILLVNILTTVAIPNVATHGRGGHWVQRPSDIWTWRGISQHGWRVQRVQCVLHPVLRQSD